MSKKVFNKIIPFILAPTVYFAYDGYKKSIMPSGYELAAKKLNINPSNQQEALLKQLQIAGYLKPQQVWKTINHLGFENPEEVFKQIYIPIKKAKADQDDPSKFDAKILRKNLGKDSKLNEQDVMDFLLYTAQNAFGRKPGQERNELTSQDWMDKYSEEYLSIAKVLGLVDRIEPHYKHYESAWIAGASRIGLMARIIDYHYMVSHYNLKIDGTTEVLAGARSLWSNIDGIIPQDRDKLIEAYNKKLDLDKVDLSLLVGENLERNKEGIEYMTYLAKSFGINLDPNKPFIEYKTKDEAPAGYFTGRVYPNYAHGEKRALDETLLAKDLLATFPGTNGQTFNIVNTAIEQNQRPNTVTTARDAAVKLLEKIYNQDNGDKTEFVVLFQTNNPYIERQTLAAQRELNKLVVHYNKTHNKNYKIKLDGVGFGCKQDVVTVHSEFAVLISEKYKDATLGTIPKRDISSLFYSTRDNSEIKNPMPDVSDIDISGGVFQDFFDEYLN